MHSFIDLIDMCISFTLETLKAVNERTIKELETSASTIYVKTLQMINLQKVILVVGMFSLFEAILQDGLGCKNGFGEAKRILDNEGEPELKEQFDNFILAINVLKHGRGRSYYALVARAESLPFRIKLPGQFFFFEGDVSEVSTLIEVDDKFVHNCANVIKDVCHVISRARSDFLMG
ncbi:MAG: hypothetical protein QHH43_04800 [Candidatus Saccharicenans sp.]|jgi:hypothetical protein|nr:hypothetical protein [Candidatus Saccharicenans sp.]MDH7575061.1 hypothetical protein [Candidatus Saccharicenans sp.]